MEKQPPEVPPEVVLINEDGTEQPPPAPRRPRFTGPSGRTRRMALLVLAALLTFVVGVGVGTFVGDGPTAHDASPGSGIAPAATTSSGAQPTGTGPVTTVLSDAASSNTGPRDSDPAGSSGPGPGATPRTASSAEQSGTDGSDGDRPGGLDQVQQAQGLCGSTIPVATVVVGQLPDAASGSLPGHIVAGSAAAVIDTGDGSWATVLSLDSSTHVTHLVRGGEAVYAQARACLGRPTVRYWRISPSSDAPAGLSPMPLGVESPNGTIVTSLITGRDPLWVQLAGVWDEQDMPPGTTTALMPSAGGDIVPMPQGLEPIAAWRDVIIGELTPFRSGMKSSADPFIIQMFSLTKGAIVDQLPSEATQVLVANGTVVWQEPCSDLENCDVHQYDIATRSGVSVEVPAMAGPRVARWLALSPGGKRLVIAVPATENARLRAGGLRSRYPMDLGVEGPEFPAGAHYGLAVIDLDTGRVTRLGGVSLPWPSASAAFSPDSQWLFVGVPTAGGAQVLAYGIHDASPTGPYLVASMPNMPGPVPIAVLPQ